MIREVQISDADDIKDIYNYYIENTIVTFEEIKISKEDMEIRIKDVAKKFPYLVYEENGKVLAYAYASSWKGRCAYKFSVESTVYLKNGLQGRGIGTKLYQELIHRLKDMKLHAVIGGIAIPNPESIKLHEKLGFEKIGYFKEVGYKKGQWLDVGYYELIL